MCKDCANYEKIPETKLNKQKIYVCYKCGCVGFYDENNIETLFVGNNYHSVDLGVLGFGSSFDNCHVKFDICDNCLAGFLKTFKLMEEAIGDKCISSNEELACKISSMLKDYSEGG